jgi:hypothetical protein
MQEHGTKKHDTAVPQLLDEILDHVAGTLARDKTDNAVIQALQQNLTSRVEKITTRHQHQVETTGGLLEEDMEIGAG